MECKNIYSYFYDAFVILTFISSVLYGYKKGFLNGFISIFSYIFSFLITNFFGRFFLNSTILGFLNSINLFNSNINLINFNVPFQKNNGAFEEIFKNSSSPFSNYLVFWILMFVLFAGFKRLFKKFFNLVSLLKKIPIIKNLDGVLGGIFGVLESVIFLIAVA